MSGIKGSKDSGSGTAKSGNGKAPTAISGIKVGRDTGIAINTARIGLAMTAASIGRATMAGSGTVSSEGTILADRPASQKRTRARVSHIFSDQPCVHILYLVSDAATLSQNATECPKCGARVS